MRANSRAECDAERKKIQQAFLDGASVHATLQALCEMAERNTQEGLQAASHAHNLEPEGLAVLAIGGFGRQVLFPYSDLDILLLFENVQNLRERSGIGGFVSAQPHARLRKASAWTGRMWNSTFR